MASAKETSPATDPLAPLERPGGVAGKLRLLLGLEDLLLWRDPGTLARLERLRDRSEPPLRSAMEQALVRVRRAHHDASDAPGRTPAALVRLLAEGSQPVRLALIQRLEAMDQFAAAPTLAAQLVRDEDPAVCAALARALGRLGGSEFLPTLRLTARHQVAAVRQGVAQGLAYQRGDRRDEILLELLGDDDRAVREAADEVLEVVRWAGADHADPGAA